MQTHFYFDYFRQRWMSVWDQSLRVSVSQWWEDTQCFWGGPTERGWDKSLCTSRGSCKWTVLSTSEPGRTTRQHTQLHKQTYLQFISGHMLARALTNLGNMHNMIIACTTHTCANTNIALSVQFSALISARLSLSWNINHIHWTLF